MPYLFLRSTPVVLLAVETAFAGGIIHVDSTAAPGGDGATWTTAIDDLQSALAGALAGDEIWLAAGTYVPAPPDGPRDVSFVLETGVSIYGGFVGDETVREQRDPLANPTVLSGDLNGDDEPAWVNHQENSERVVVTTAASAVLDGLTVRGGYGASQYGCGLHIDGGSVAVRGCLITDNLGAFGAGIASTGGTLTLIDGTVSANRAWTGRGGGLYGAAGSTLSISGCTFQGNAANGGSSVGDGGAIFLESGVTALIQRCVFTSNQSTASSPNFANGGAIASLSDDLTILASDFRDNSALVGGALGNFGDSTVVNCRFTGNDALTGGAIFNFFDAVDYVNCVIVGNDASDGGGFANGFGSDVTIVNSIVWANTSPGQPTYEAQVHDLDGGGSHLRYSCVQALLETIPGEDPPDPADFPGCIDDDPAFVDLPGRDLHLAADSPCIDAGDSGAVPAGVTTDLDGAPRFIDDPATPDGGAGSPPIVDMGAFEVQIEGPPGDVDGDGDVDFTDLIALLATWGACPTPPASCPADVDGDGSVGFADLLALLANWSS